MKKQLIIYLILIAILASCSKDLGNYDYIKVNSYTIIDIKTGEGSNKNYDVLFGQQLKIEPRINSLFEDSNPNISYLWIIEKDTVSKNKNLDLTIDLPIALYQAQFVLIDHNTGLQYKKAFAVNVTSPYGRGYFFLNEDDNHNTILSFKAVSDDLNFITNSDNINGTKFGKYPLRMNGVRKYNSGPDDYRWEVYILSKEGQYSVVLADLTRYAPVRFFDKNSYMGSWGNEYEFNPSHVDLKGIGRTYFISNGRIAFYDENNLFRHSLLFDNTADYRLDDALIGDANRFSGIRSLIGFDLLSSTFKLLSAYPNSDPSIGIVYNRGLLDRVLDIESPTGLFDGHRIASSYSSYVNSTELLNSKVFTIKDNSIHLSDFNAAYAQPYLPILTYLGVQSLPGLSSGAPMSIFENHIGDAYLAIKSKIYKSSLVSLNFTPYLDVDASLGAITALKYQITSSNSISPRLFICTYDPSSNERLKGSILVYDVNTKKLIHELKNVTNKVVDIFLAE